MSENGLKVKGIFLDLDGTVVDSEEAYLEAARIAFQSGGQKPPERRTVLEIPKRIEQGFAVSDLVKGDIQKFLGTYLKAYYSITREKTRLIPNVSETLEILSEKAKLALVTMRHVPKHVIREELEGFGISKYFTYVVTALDTSVPKPSPEALMKCGEALDVKINDCIIIGDSVNDVRAGKAAGAKTVAVLSGLFRYQELAKEKPYLILRDVTALPKFIK
jgi:phosphoglycolate phosphatase